VFFQGIDNRVWRIELDGSQGIVLGANLSSNSPPFVASNYVFFQGTDKSVWRCNLDGTDAFILGGNLQSSSSPVVCGSFVYFQGTDNTFWRTNLDGTNAIHMEGWKIASTPFIDLANNYIFFQGTDNTFWRCNLDGSNGVKMSGFATSDSPFVVSSINQPKKGSAYPRYKVLTILYAPPGTTGASGKSSSSVAYGHGSTTGTTSSIDKSFQSSYDFSVTAGVGNSKPGSDGGSAGVTGDFNTSTKTDNTNSIAVTKSESIIKTVPGPAADGINHDEDKFMLWLNPVIDISIDPENNMDWGIGVNGAFMNIQDVNAGWLRDPSTLPDGLKEELDAAHLTTDDYKTILSLDPFLSDEATIDTKRFLLTTQAFPYEPPLNAADSAVTTTYTQSSVVTNTATKTVTQSYGVSATVAAGFNIGIFSASTKDTASFTWTDASSNSTVEGTTQSATVIVGGPSFGYQGSTEVLVYWDRVYSSFMFAFATEKPSSSGHVLGKDGKPVAHVPVTLTVGTQTYGTFTHASGQYNIYGAPSTPKAKLTVSGQDFTVDVDPRADFRLRGYAFHCIGAWLSDRVRAACVMLSTCDRRAASKRSRRTHAQSDR
jgi:Domain of unknown function (DUF5050)